MPSAFPILSPTYVVMQMCSEFLFCTLSAALALISLEAVVLSLVTDFGTLLMKKKTYVDLWLFCQVP